MIIILAAIFGLGVIAAGLTLVVINQRDDNRDIAYWKGLFELLRTQPKGAITGPVLEPVFEPGKPSREKWQVFAWTVRKQDDGRYAVIPIDKDGEQLWELAVAQDITDPVDAWKVANQGQKALGWRR